MKKSGEIIWQADAERVSNTYMMQFLQYVSDNCVSANNVQTWDDLYFWSIKHRLDFWSCCEQFLEIDWISKPEVIYKNSVGLFYTGKWFPGATLNFAKNLLPVPDQREVITSIIEGLPKRKITAMQLWNQVACCAASLKKRGIGKGDRVAGVLANGLEAIVAMLATTSLGAIWSSCSPDFGSQGISDRFGQINAKCLFFTTGYQYNGKYYSCVDTIESCLTEMSTVKTIVLIDSFNRGSEATADYFSWNSFLDFADMDLGSSTPLDLEFTETAFDHPVYIMFSSGTTGVPKCIVHGAGGTLLQHKKEQMLHTDIKPEDLLFYFTTCGWMMWNWMVSNLSTGAALLVFDGAPAYPDFGCLWKLLEQEKVTAFGTSPKFIQACINDGVEPGKEYDLSSLKTVLSTGSPLLPEHFNWIYSHVKQDLHLASICGGTDIISCFLLGNPILPVRIGEVQSPGLGMAMECWDEEGHSVKNQKGELVCCMPFVSMPVCFWNDNDLEKYRSTYFDRYTDPVVWWHGDFIEVKDSAGIIVHGRSDTTLNPGGVRIGIAEIYRRVEQMHEIDDSVVIGHAVNGDVDIILFVKLAKKLVLDEKLVTRIKKQIRSNLTPRHVPARIFAVTDIPYTRSGKKVELAVTRAFHGQKIDNMIALINPQSIEEYRKLGQGD